jgi:hypothetical protein
LDADLADGLAIVFLHGFKSVNPTSAPCGKSKFGPPAGPFNDAKVRWTSAARGLLISSLQILLASFYLVDFLD